MSAPAAPTCPRDLRALVPPTATQWWLLRPRAIFAHPRLGAALSRSVDHLAERALIDRAARTGYDLRAVEQGLWAATPAGELALGLGAFDGAHILALLWERLLPPRRQSQGARGVARVEGRLARAEVTAAIDSRCGIAAWAEGDTRLVDPALLPPSEAEATAGSAREVVRGRIDLDDARATEALGPLRAQVRSVEVSAELTDRGVALAVSLRGALAPEVEGMIRARVARMTQSALLRAAGASTWCADARVGVARESDVARVTVEVPWEALDALAEVVRGEVRDARDPALGF
ncbi:MAG: hypothetical protein U0325_07715 [Polyangiales bacterium]